MSDSAERLKLIDTLRYSVEPFYTSVPKCFEPRLGIRVVSNGQTTELVICFGCMQAQAFQGGKVVAEWITNRAPKAAFNQVLQAAGIPLAPDDD